MNSPMSKPLYDPRKREILARLRVDPYAKLSLVEEVILDSEPHRQVTPLPRTGRPRFTQLTFFGADGGTDVPALPE